MIDVLCITVVTQSPAHIGNNQSIVLAASLSMVVLLLLVLLGTFVLVLCLIVVMKHRQSKGETQTDRLWIN